MDEVEVRVEASEGLFSDKIKELVGIMLRLENYIHDEIGLRVKVTLIEPKTLPRSEGKAVRVIDKRKL
jgi:phenylacetate-CoA ligase